MRDIVFLVADGAMAEMLKSFFGRDAFHKSLRCAPFKFDARIGEDVIVAPTKDPGVYGTAHELLKPYERSHQRAVIMLDADWDGSPGVPAIREQVSRYVARAWSEFVVIVIEPELEAWLWQDNPHIAEIFKFPADFRQLLAESGHWPLSSPKPSDPKGALDYLRRRYKLRVFNNHYGKLAGKISVKNCQDPAFNLLCQSLRSWFPAS